MAYNIIQWGSGNVGSQAIAAIAQRRDLKLKGLFVYSQDKVGRDAGEIAGIGRIGVKATNNVEKILALDADCVIHSPLSSLVYGEDPEADLKTICALLASGKNVISTVGYMYPKVYGARVMNRLAQACRRGGSSFHGTGANPGWLGDLVPLTMSALSGRVDQIVIQEISNFEHYPSAPDHPRHHAFWLKSGALQTAVGALLRLAHGPVSGKYPDGGRRYWPGAYQYRYTLQSRACPPGLAGRSRINSQGQHRRTALGMGRHGQGQETHRA